MTRYTTPSLAVGDMNRSYGRPAGRLVMSAVAALVLAGTPSLALAQGGVHGIDPANFDRSVRPQDDFFRYVNGGWLARSEIPSDASSWGAFQELRERSRDALHTILEDVSHSNAAAGTEARKVGDLYASYMDSTRIEQVG